MRGRLRRVLLFLMTRSICSKPYVVNFYSGRWLTWLLLSSILRSMNLEDNARQQFASTCLPQDAGLVAFWPWIYSARTDSLF